MLLFMNRTLSRVGSLCLLTLPLCFAVPKQSSKAIAASEEVNITSFDCTYNSETSKYDCLVEGVNNTEKYMVLSELKMIANSNDYFPIKTDNPFFTSLLIKPGESFEAKYETTLENSVSGVRFYPSYVTWDVNDIDFVRLVRYENEQATAKFASVICFYLEFDDVLRPNRFVNNEDCYFDFRAINFITYNGTNHCVCSNYVAADYSEVVEVCICSDQTINASEINFEDVIIVERKVKRAFGWTDEDRANLIRVFRYILLALLCGGIVFAVGSIIYFVIRRRKKQISNK